MTRTLSAAISAVLCLATLPADGATFPFGSNANGIHDQPTGLLTDGGVALRIASGPDGALLNEIGRAGLGVSSIGIDGVTRDAPDKFDVVTGAGHVDGVSEFVTLSFDRSGVITKMNFDGVKDESLEYFVLTGENGQRVTFFDSAANISVPGAVDAAIGAGVVTGQVVFLLEDAVFDDDAIGLSIPFAAGETLTLTYFELGAQFGPTEAGNGARLTSITVETVPEPGAAVLALVAAPWLIGRPLRNR